MRPPGAPSWQQLIAGLQGFGGHESVAPESIYGYRPNVVMLLRAVAQSGEIVERMRDDLLAARILSLRCSGEELYKMLIRLRVF